MDIRSEHAGEPVRSLGEFRALQRQLDLRKKSMATLVNTVFSNLPDISDPLEKVQLLQSLNTEFYQQVHDQNQERMVIRRRARREEQKISGEISQLIGVRLEEQPLLIDQLVGELESAHQGLVDSLQSLDRQSQGVQEGQGAQAELFRFAANVEKAETLYESLRQLRRIMQDAALFRSCA